MSVGDRSWDVKNSKPMLAKILNPWGAFPVVDFQHRGETLTIVEFAAKMLLLWKPCYAIMDSVNLNVFDRPEVVSHYAAMSIIWPCEKLVFDRYIRPGIALLDVGVGGGRTTGYLSATVSRYVGIDYSEEMIRVCKSRFPHLEFRCADAADLSGFSDSSFDAVVMAYNGIDALSPEGRSGFLQECFRVLRRGGVFIFSAHNPRA